MVHRSYLSHISRLEDFLVLCPPRFPHQFYFVLFYALFPNKSGEVLFEVSNMCVFFLTVWTVYDTSLCFPVNLCKVIAYSVFFISVIVAVVDLAFPIDTLWGVCDGDTFK